MEGNREGRRGGRKKEGGRREWLENRLVSKTQNPYYSGETKYQ